MTISLRCASCFAVLALCLSTTTSQAASILIDTFDQGTNSIAAGITGVYDNYVGPGPLGGTRFAYARAASGTQARIDINTGSTLGVAKAYRNNSNAPIRQIGWGNSPAFDGATFAGTALNLNLTDAGTIEIDVQEVIKAWSNYPKLTIWANGGSEVFEYNLYTLFPGMQAATATPQTLSVILNAPSSGTFNSGDLNDIDGIRLRWYDQADTIISEVRATDGGAVPEPSSLVLAGLGLMGLVGYGLRRRKK